MEIAAHARILKQRAEHRFGIQVLERIADDDLPAERLGAGFHDGNGLRQALFVDKEGAGLRLRHAMGQRHRLCGGSGLVEQRGIGDIEPRQIGDQRLEIEQRLEPALADLRLIRRIGRVPGGIFQDIALDRGRHDRAVITLADERGQHAVLVGRRTQPVKGPALGQRTAEIERRLLPDRCRHGFINELFQARNADNAQHLRNFLRRGADMAAIGEVVGIVSVGCFHACSAQPTSLL